MTRADERSQSLESALVEKINFDTDGLVPCVVQDWRTGEVLTLAYMSRESLRKTTETKETHFYSRSRGEIWHKGETSGNLQQVRAIRYDCDADSLVCLVEPLGPACHTGERSCFYSGDTDPGAFEALPALERTIADRSEAARSESYTASLLAEPGRIREKVLEEAEEVTRAADTESQDRVREEAADLVYHLAVLLASEAVSVSEVFEELNARRR
jgi:phosphoribosyl-ATP pyrophosphohydrolase/phosphoribosyl-AMP cyclohydrolase